MSSFTARDVSQIIHNPAYSKANKLQVFQLAVLQDNYIYILKEIKSGLTAVVDPALAEPVHQFLEEKNWSLDFILNTHHHYDHTGGNLSLKKKWKCEIAAFAEDANRIPGISIHLKDGELFSFGNLTFEVLFVPGHTLGHIAFWFKETNLLFCGDTLFAMGCGRLFEGSYQQMFNSLKKIKSLPKETAIYCAHEYTKKNGQFALKQDPENPDLKARMVEVNRAREKCLPTIPFFLSEELKTNPFLRAQTVEQFSKLRALKDSF